MRHDTIKYVKKETGGTPNKIMLIPEIQPPYIFANFFQKSQVVRRL